MTNKETQALLERPTVAIGGKSWATLDELLADAGGGSWRAIKGCLDLLTQVTRERDAMAEAWLGLRHRLNSEHNEGIIDYRELKTGVNSAAIIMRAGLGEEGFDAVMARQSEYDAALNKPLMDEG